MPPQPIPVVTAPPVPASAAPPAVSCASGACDKDKAHCGYVHRQEKPPSLYFLPGHCLPVCAPDHSPGYGYYPTQWRPWPGPAASDPALTP